MLDTNYRVIAYSSNFPLHTFLSSISVKHISAHLTLLERALAVDFLSVCPSVKCVDCDKKK